MVCMHKAIIRRNMLAQRKGLDADKAMKRIIGYIPDLTDWAQVQRVHVYRASKSFNEVATTLIVQYINNNFPKIDISQPGQSADAVMPKEKFDIILVPIVAFDKNLNRIGMGSGWYDKFLACNPQALKIGIAYDESYVQNIESEPHDVRLDIVITPTRLLNMHQLQ